MQTCHGLTVSASNLRLLLLAVSSVPVLLVTCKRQERLSANELQLMYTEYMNKEYDLHGMLWRTSAWYISEAGLKMRLHDATLGDITHTNTCASGLPAMAFIRHMIGQTARIHANHIVNRKP